MVILGGDFRIHTDEAKTNLLVFYNTATETVSRVRGGLGRSARPKGEKNLF